MITFKIDLLCQTMLLLYLLNLVLSSNAQSTNQIVTKCSGYQDSRISPTDINSILVPFSRTSQASYLSSINTENSLIFNLAISENETQISFKCHLSNTEIKRLAWNFSKDETAILQPRSFHNVTLGSAERHQHSYFTNIGYFYDAASGNYYKPVEQYCIQSISDDGIDLRICATNSNCTKNSKISNTYCLPKCCGLDETLMFWKMQCEPKNETNLTASWSPPIYQGLNNHHKKVDSQKVNIIYQMSQLPKSCSLAVYEDDEILEEEHYRRMISTNVEHHSDPDLFQEQDHVKLVLPDDMDENRKIKIISFHDGSRKWLLDPLDNYCVEGFDIETEDGGIRKGKLDDFVIIHCEENYEENEEIGQEWKTWVYVATSVLALLFLLATIIIYGILWDKHNLHGLTIASYAVSTFGSYFFLTVAQMISLYPSEEFTGLHDRGPVCYTIATLAHYFYFSSFLWLTIMNFDLWMTFKSIRIAGRGSKDWPKYGIYSIFTWLLPACIIFGFVVVDHVYRDPLTEVPVPDYAMGICFVSQDFRKEYVYIPNAILFAINFVLIFMTMRIFLKARSHTSKTFGPGRSSNSNRYNAKLFLKLFVVMGGTSAVDFLTWNYDKVYKPWPVVVLEVLNYFTPVVLFFLFCLNEKVIIQLWEKYPRFIVKMRPMLKIFVRMDDNWTSDAADRSTSKYRMSSVKIRKGSIPLQNANQF